MKIQLNEATAVHSGQIWEMQRKAFAELLERYQDKETNPGAEGLERVRQRFEDPRCHHYFIEDEDGGQVGVIRIYETRDRRCKLSCLFVLPDHRGGGIAQQALSAVEKLYPQATAWELDTIKQERALCHLYEKMGYRLTGGEHILKEGMTIVDYVKQMS